MQTKQTFFKLPSPGYFLIALLLTLPLSAQAALTIQHWTTPQGARVVFVESHELPMLDVAVDFPAGSARDPAAKPGLAQLTHGLLDQGAGGLSETAIAHGLADVADGGKAVHFSETLIYALKAQVQIQDTEADAG